MDASLTVMMPAASFGRKAGSRREDDAEPDDSALGILNPGKRR